MSLNEFIDQIKTPGKYAVKFVSEVQQVDKDGNKVIKLQKDSISLQLVKRANMELIKNEIDYNNILDRGAKLNEKIKGLKNLTTSKSEALNEFLTIQGLPKDLKINVLRFIFFVDVDQTTYNSYKLDKLYSDETQILKFEKVALSLDDAELKAIKTSLSDAKKDTSLSSIGKEKTRLLEAEKIAQNKAKNSPKATPREEEVVSK